LFEIDERVTAPDFPLDLLPREYFLWARDKQAKHFAGLRSEVKEGIALAQFTGLGVKLERSEPQKKRVIDRGGHGHILPAE